MLAAGVGIRLGDAAENLPKVMLSFGGKTLLERHIEALMALGVDELVIGTGFRAELIEAELARLGVGAFARTAFNPRFPDGSLLTMLSLGDAVGGNSEILLMDGDVLYDGRLLAGLVASRHRNCFLMDYDFEPGDDPVKLCLRDGRIVDFHKQVGAIPFDACGESVGFFRFDPPTFKAILAAGRKHSQAGRHDLWYEEAIRDVLLQDGGNFGFEDITGLAWIEIDFAADVRRAASEILPRIEGRDSRGLAAVG